MYEEVTDSPQLKILLGTPIKLDYIILYFCLTI